MADAPSLRLLVDSWDLFRDPVLVGAAAGCVLGYMGVYIVLRRMVFVAATLSQAAGLGVALAFYAEIHLGATGLFAAPRAWAFALALATAIVLRWDGGRMITREGLLALAYLLGGAGALLVGTRITQEAHDIQGILFGTGVLVSPEDLTWVLGTGAVALVWQVWWRRGFLLASLDPDGAHVRGLPVVLLDGILLATIAVLVSVATRALGALPVFAFSVLPALAALMLAASPGQALAIAALLGLLSGSAGYVLAFFAQFPVGASQTFTAAAFVLLALAWKAALQALRAT